MKSIKQASKSPMVVQVLQNYYAQYRYTKEHMAGLMNLSLRSFMNVKPTCATKVITQSDRSISSSIYSCITRPELTPVDYLVHPFIFYKNRTVLYTLPYSYTLLNENLLINNLVEAYQYKCKSYLLGFLQQYLCHCGHSISEIDEIIKELFSGENNSSKHGIDEKYFYFLKNILQDRKITITNVLRVVERCKLFNPSMKHFKDIEVDPILYSQNSNVYIDSLCLHSLFSTNNWSEVFNVPSTNVSGVIMSEDKIKFLD